jgi:hypothetical protein
MKATLTEVVPATFWHRNLGKAALADVGVWLGTGLAKLDEE